MSGQAVVDRCEVKCIQNIPPECRALLYPCTRVGLGRDLVAGCSSEEMVEASVRVREVRSEPSLGEVPVSRGPVKGTRKEGIR